MFFTLPFIIKTLYNNTPLKEAVIYYEQLHQGVVEWTAFELELV